MVKCKAYYLVVIILISCSNLRRVTTLHYPPGLDSSFISAQLKFGSFKGSYPGQTMTYRVFSDSLISSEYRDSALTFGIILPASSLVASGIENKMIFGTDSLRCAIHYGTLHIFKSEEQSSVLFDIITPREKRPPGYDPYATTTTTYKKLLFGSIQHPMYSEEIRIFFDEETIRQDFDSAHIHGYIKTSTDSFLVKALYNEIPLHGKNVKPMQILQGYSLQKADTLYAFLQHAPMVKSKDELFIDSKLSPRIRMLIAAYFSLVSRLVHSSSDQRIF